MTQYQGNVQSYVLEIQSPNSPYDQKGVISLHGAFGLAILYFVPQDGQLGKNQKRAEHDIFDICYWMKPPLALKRRRRPTFISVKPAITFIRKRKLDYAADRPLE